MTIYIVVFGDQASMESWVQCAYNSKEKAYDYARAELTKKRLKRDRLWCRIEAHDVNSEEA